MRSRLAPTVRRGLIVLALARTSVGAQAPQIVPEPTEATRKHLAARRAGGRITLDGRLDEATWGDAQVASDFSVTRPDYRPSTRFPTTVRVLFDSANLYLGVVSRDTAGARGFRVPDLRRDFETFDTDVFAVSLGPLGDHRTTFQLQVSPLGSQADVQAFDGGDQFNFNWDAMWRVRTTTSDTGWVAELSIPWASIRYARGLTSWDVNFVRNTRRALEWSAWTPFPRQFSSWRLTYAGVLDSLAPPPPRTNLRIRPFALGQTQRTANGWNSASDIGGEVIWAPTANSLLEATVHTDFAQADVDRQVVNLTRFGVFFPERRQFFLENADLLGASGLNGRYVVQPFFSRRIGLAEDGTPRPIAGGSRYVYRSGRTNVGALVMREGASAAGAATFGVARVSQFFGRSTRVGSLVAVRDAGTSAAGRNVVLAVDAITRIGEQVQFNTMLSTSSDAGRTGVAATYGMTRSTPRSMVGLTGGVVNKDYTPRTGFVSRPNVLLTSPMAQWTLQPRWRPAGIVWFRPMVNAQFFHDPSSRRLQEGSLTANTEILHRSGAQLLPYVERSLQRPTSAIPILPNVTIAPGTHDYLRMGFDVRTDQS
ncbi:MAG: carbohydrate binding family 9 domain-containing protein, partial [Gemmatimonadaceae bacterium]|nr:carbohydrate binding family 9 domain-containing protein [Gemmatimonadaceae bacterium]